MNKLVGTFVRSACLMIVAASVSLNNTLYGIGQTGITIVNGGLYGIYAVGNRNNMTDNTVLESSIWDLLDSGVGNKWQDNHYETSSWENP